MVGIEDAPAFRFRLSEPAGEFGLGSSAALEGLHQRELESVLPIYRNPHMVVPRGGRSGQRTACGNDPAQGEAERLSRVAPGFRLVAAGGDRFGHVGKDDQEAAFRIGFEMGVVNVVHVLTGLAQSMPSCLRMVFT